MAKARTRCPEQCIDGYTYSSGDGWEEWDECRCCNPKGDNDTGMVSKRRLAAFRKEEAEAEAHAEAMVHEHEAEMAKPCPKCGMKRGDHANRNGEPCKSIEQANREYAAERATKNADRPTSGDTHG